MARSETHIRPHPSFLDVLNGALRDSEISSNLTTRRLPISQGFLDFKHLLSVKRSSSLQRLSFAGANSVDMRSAVEKTDNGAILNSKLRRDLLWLGAFFSHCNNAIQVFLSKFCVRSVDALVNWMKSCVKGVFNVLRASDPLKVFGPVVSFVSIDVIDFVLRSRLRFQEGKGNQSVDMLVPVLARIRKINLKITSGRFYIAKSSIGAAVGTTCKPHNSSLVADLIGAFPPWYVTPFLRHGSASRFMTPFYLPFCGLRP